MGNYLPRVADESLRFKLETKGAVLIEGAKWCGKTTTGEQYAKSIFFLNDPTFQEQNILLAEVNPQAVLQGAVPRLIDEWQIVPKLWDAVRFEVDHRKEFGQFILTGSSVPPDLTKIRHSGVGRITRLKMRPMSLFESRNSSGQISLRELFNNPEKQIFASCSPTLKELTFLICRGGWPLSVFLEGEKALIQSFDYVSQTVESDIMRVDSTKRDRSLALQLLRSYARFQGSQTSVAEILKDLEQSSSRVISRETIDNYLNALRNIFVIEDMPAWNPNLRSKTAIRTSDTRYFVDPSIATASLGAGPDDLEKDLKTCGFLFETLCVRDLRIYAEPLFGEVLHFRDKSGLECDAVVHLRNGSYGLIEIKLGGEKLVEEGATTLKKLAEKIDTDKMKKPAFLMVLAGVTPYAYRREDGVLVVPIQTLGP